MRAAKKSWPAGNASPRWNKHTSASAESWEQTDELQNLWWADGAAGQDGRPDALPLPELRNDVSQENPTPQAGEQESEQVMKYQKGDLVVFTFLDTEYKGRIESIAYGCYFIRNGRRTVAVSEQQVLRKESK